MATPVEDKLVAPPEYIHEAPIPTTHIQYINKPAYNLVDFINDNIGIMTVLCFFILVMIIAWFFFGEIKKITLLSVMTILRVFQREKSTISLLSLLWLRIRYHCYSFVSRSGISFVSMGNSWSGCRE